MALAFTKTLASLYPVAVWLGLGATAVYFYTGEMNRAHALSFKNWDRSGEDVMWTDESRPSRASSGATLELHSRDQTSVSPFKAN